ncbi:MAG: hypothetical protein MIO92_04880 [Methanosarcinaceae archaeon]|nr:hypothetical protein [Methanosarcinaceae archaeon]
MYFTEIIARERRKSLIEKVNRISRAGLFPGGVTGLAVVDAGADDWKKKKEEKHGTP